MPAPPPPRWTWQPHLRGQAAEPRVRAWLAAELGCPAEAVAFVRDRHGRPQLQPPLRRHDASWSHSGEGLLIALGEDARIGADLERIRPRPRAGELAARFFHTAEAAWLAALAEPERTLAFVRLWCAKEAVLKAHGRGLAFGLHRLRFTEHAGALRLADCDPTLGPAEAWRLHEFEPHPGYRAALAWRARG
ncbi:4'-phosphopantetheinyl transferase family protein [Vulcaniibacterium gelatinicum]|uniref:4'-phosphopantetheinyl transferase family protein n=1 Tax=Vulcaniibacterium gelatinicum TaxID=2598725 RepID=UPI0011C7349F|nr:4'-phosphopantetheinyl transferase superfamily protein [Vulcaniibacterium gelatinicum]